MKRTTRASLIAATAFGALVAAAAGQAGTAANTVLICHGTAATDNPYSLISVDVNALNGHIDAGHGWRNAPDFLLPDGYATCADALAGGGQQ